MGTNIGVTYKSADKWARGQQLCFPVINICAMKIKSLRSRFPKLARNFAFRSELMLHSNISRWKYFSAKKASSIYQFLRTKTLSTTSSQDSIRKDDRRGNSSQMERLYISTCRSFIIAAMHPASLLSFFIPPSRGSRKECRWTIFNP